MVTALKIEPGKNPVPYWLCDDNEYLNHCVSPDEYLAYKATALKIDNGIAAIYCRDGHMFCLPGNRCVNGHIICGVFYIVRVKDGKLKSLTDTDVVKYSLKYWEAETYNNDDEIIESWLIG
jgi:hypothetical protein